MTHRTENPPSIGELKRIFMKVNGNEKKPPFMRDGD